jgi:hypothetical protein
MPRQVHLLAGAKSVRLKSDPLHRSGRPATFASSVAGQDGLGDVDCDAAGGGGGEQLVQIGDTVVTQLRLHDDRCLDKRRGGDHRIVGVGQLGEESISLRLAQKDGGER